MRLVLVDNNVSVTKSLQLYFRNVFYEQLLVYPDVHQEPPKDGDSIVLREPVEIYNAHYSIYSQWCSYALKQGLNLRIIILTTEGVDQLERNPFCINIIDLSKTLREKFQTIFSYPAKPDTTIPDKSNFDDIIIRLKTFFKGHGEGSLIKNLNDIYQDVSMAPVLVAQGDNSVEECIDKLILKWAKPRWEIFKERYHKYLIYFRYLPYYTDILLLAENFHTIDSYFTNIPRDEKEFIHTDMRPPFLKILKTLDDIDRLYIKSEGPIK